MKNFTLKCSKNNDFPAFFSVAKMLFSVIFCVSRFVLNFCDFLCFVYLVK